MRSPLGVAVVAAILAFHLVGTGSTVADPGPERPTAQRTHCARPAPAPATAADHPPGHRLLDVAEAWRFSRGTGVRVAVIDTGVTAHPRLPLLTGGGDFVSTSDGLTDCDLHGTLIAGIIAARPGPDDDFAGVAPEAAIISIRQSSGAYDVAARDRPPALAVGAGYGPVSTLARAIVRAVDLGAGVINISQVACAPTASALDDAQVAAALDHAHRRDAVVVAAAGNLTESGACREQGAIATPARFGGDGALTVGAVDTGTGRPADFGLRGPWVGVAAPGTQIVSVAGERTVTALDGERGPRPLAGTSYSAAYVSGVVALVRARFPGLRAAEVIDRIVATAGGGSAGNEAIGAGVVDPVAALTRTLPALPDPGAGRELAAPQSEAREHTAAIAVAVTAAVGAAVLGGAFAATRFGPGATRAATRRSASPRRW